MLHASSRIHPTVIYHEPHQALEPYGRPWRTDTIKGPDCQSHDQRSYTTTLTGALCRSKKNVPGLRRDLPEPPILRL